MHNRFELKKVLGRGSFSVVYKAFDNATKKSVAIKLIDKESFHLGRAEVDALKTVNNSDYFPKLVCSGQYEDYYMIAMQRLGPSLGALMKKEHFSLPEVADLGIRMTMALETLHEHHLIHRDLKLENIASHLKDKSKFYLIDFGLSKKYRDAKTKFHYPENRNHFFKGNLLFCSNNVLSGVQASRRDYVISLILILIFLVKRTLPWVKCLGSVETMIGQRTATTLEMLTEHLPEGIAQCYRYVMTLGFYQKPDYQRIINALRTVKDSTSHGLTKTICTHKRGKSTKSKKTSKVLKSITEYAIKNDYGLECSTIKMLAPGLSEQLRMKLRLQTSKTEFLDSF